MTDIQEGGQVGVETHCEICKLNTPFSLPQSLVDDCLAGDLVVFAGAGVSTENGLVHPDSLYDEIADELGLLGSTEMEFDLLATQFVETYDRRALIHLVRRRFDYIDSFVDLRWQATRFHQELATIYQIDTIFTTNWDTYFETVTAATPIVTPDDYALWDFPGRKVVKIHGSMGNIGSIVATHGDYETCYERLSGGIIGASLKHLLGTKTIVFAGYSFRDSDFLRIYQFLQSEMGGVLPRAFVVSPFEWDKTEFPAIQWIQTDGAYFFHRLKQEVSVRGSNLDDSVYGEVSGILDAVHGAKQAASVFSQDEYPSLIYNHAYQDGLRHACERILTRRAAGEYSDGHRVLHLVRDYDASLVRLRRRKQYHDVAYAEGYVNVMLALLVADEGNDALQDMPLFYVLGAPEIRDFDDFADILERSAELHKTGHRIASRLVRKHPGSVFSHTPFLDVRPP